MSDPVVIERPKFLARVGTVLGSDGMFRVAMVTGLLLVAFMPTMRGCQSPPSPPGPDADHPVLLPETLELVVGRMFKLQGKGVGPLVWSVPPISGVKLDYHIEGDSLVITPLPLAKGLTTDTCEVGAYTVVGGKASETKWVKVKTSLSPPDPGPIPPVPPNPDGAFVALLQSAYLLDGRPQTQLGQLAAIYRNSDQVLSAPSSKTPSDVFNAMHKSIVLILKEPDSNKITVLPATRKAIAVELDKSFPLGPASTQPLTAEIKALITAQFARVTKALEAVK